MLGKCETCGQAEAHNYGGLCWDCDQKFGRRTCPACGNIAYSAHGIHANPHKAYVNADGYICMACYQRNWRRARKSIINRSCEACGVAFSPKRADAKFCSNACRQAAHRAGFAPVTKRASDAPKSAPVVTGATIVCVALAQPACCASRVSSAPVENGTSGAGKARGRSG
jgi:hypothetical protein